MSCGANRPCAVVPSTHGCCTLGAVLWRRPPIMLACWSQAASPRRGRKSPLPPPTRKPTCRSQRHTMNKLPRHVGLPLMSACPVFRGGQGQVRSSQLPWPLNCFPWGRQTHSPSCWPAPHVHLSPSMQFSGSSGWGPPVFLPRGRQARSPSPRPTLHVCLSLFFCYGQSQACSPLC